MSYIEVTRDGAVLEIYVNRPQKMNALSPAMYRDLSRAYTELDRDPALRVGLLHAAGPHFSAGVELDQWAAVFAGGAGFPLEPGACDPFCVQSAPVRKPIVMAVQGYCYTWGVEVMLNTDVRVAAEDTRFAMLEVQRGIYPCGGATLRLPQQMGWANAQRYLLTGDAWSAAEAHRLGLVQEVVMPGEQTTRARELAGRIARAAPLGVQAVLRSSRLAREQGEAAAAAQLFPDLAPIMRSEDAAEGVRSFVERRQAVFQGR